MEAIREELQPRNKLIQYKKYPKGSTLYRQGFNHASSVYFLLEGTVSLRHVYPDGQEHIHSFLWPGDMFGEVNDDPFCENTAKAVTEITVHEVPRKSLLSNDKQVLGYAWDTIRQLSKQYRQLLSHVAQIRSAKTADRKLAYFLLHLIQKSSYRENGEIYISMPMQNKEVANHLLIHYETISRSLRRLYDSKIIDKQNHRSIKLLDVEKLKAVMIGEKILF